MLKDGKKKFDIRLADFEVAEGDTIIFEEWDPEEKEYTGRILKMEVTLLMKTKDLQYWKEEEVNKYGFNVMQVQQSGLNTRIVEAVVATMIRNPKGEILFVKSIKFDDLWVLPGGHIEVGEKILDAAVREAFEETNLNTSAVKLISTHELIYSHYFKRNSHMISLNCLLDAEDTDVRLNNELTDYKWINPKVPLKEIVAEIYKEMLNEYINSIT